LSHGIEVVEGEFSLPGYQRTSILPPVWKRNEIGRRRELDVEVQILLETGYLTENLVTIWNELYVYSIVVARQPWRTAVAPPVR
jgi:hypothetical protein